MHVPELTWIVIEDAENATELVTNLLARCEPVKTIHLTAKSPPTSLKGLKVPRGVAQRNAGLNWIRRNCSGALEEEECRGVVYFMDDDNKYDLRLFKEVSRVVYFSA